MNSNSDFNEYKQLKNKSDLNENEDEDQRVYSDLDD